MPYILDYASWELRHKALVALLDHTSIDDDGAMPPRLRHPLLRTIEEIHEGIDCPMDGEVALELWRALRDAGVEPTYETWCYAEEHDREKPEVAALRLAIQASYEIEGWQLPGSDQVVQ